MRIQRSAEHHVVAWANGLGVTADVFVWPAETTDWTWRLSIADVSDDLPFSVMPGIDRHIMVGTGAGMALTIDGGPEHRMDRGTPPLSFDGESITTCRLLDGPIADLNLMVRRAAGTGSLRAVRLSAGHVVSISADDVALVVLDGVMQFRDDQLAAFDALSRAPGESLDVVAVTETVCAVASVRVD